MGIEVISESDAQFNWEKHQPYIEAILAMKLVIVSLPVDTLATASVYKKAADTGIKLVFMDNSPKGLRKRHFR